MFPACSKYLDVPPDDQLSPRTVEDYSNILNGEGWNRSLTPTDINLSFLEALTDDVAEDQTTHFDSSQKSFLSAFYTWQNKYDQQYDSRKAPSRVMSDTWLGLYRIIKVCNVILEAENSMTGNSAEIQYLLGEARFSRALAYYFLVNLWGRPYDPATAQDPVGVPLKTSSTVENTALPRNSVQAVYDQILEDLYKAEQHVLTSGRQTNIFHYSPRAVYLILSRIHLYMRHWEAAAAYAGKCILQNPGLEDFNTISTPYGFPVTNSPELIYTFYNSSNTIYNTHSYNLPYPVSDSLLQQFEPGDKRHQVYFSRDPLGSISTSLVPMLSVTAISTGFSAYFLRTSEAYLNRAEAYAHLNNKQGALDDLNFLRKHRIANAPVLDADSPATLLQKVLLERRKELPFQLHRWFDLRRTGSPAIIHFYTPQASPTQQFVLQPNDPGYTLEIPEAALGANPSLTPLGLALRQPE